MPATRAGDDRVLVPTRVLAAAIVPFLVVAFVVLYVWPGETERLFAWTIRPTLTPMVLGAVYLGGAHFFVQAWRAEEWHRVKVGFIPVATFASLLGAATLLHWDRFNHGHPAFWLWSGLYLTTPFLVVGVWLLNRRREGPAGDEPRLSAPVRFATGATGLLSLGLGLFLFLRPEQAVDLWPWTLTALTSRVMGAVFCLGVAGIGIVADARWSTARVMVQTEQVMVSLILLAMARGWRELDLEKVFTWMLLAGLAGVLAASTVFGLSMDRRNVPSPE